MKQLINYRQPLNKVQMSMIRALIINFDTEENLAELTLNCNKQINKIKVKN